QALPHAATPRAAGRARGDRRRRGVAARARRVRGRRRPGGPGARRRHRPPRGAPGGSVGRAPDHGTRAAGSARAGRLDEGAEGRRGRTRRGGVAPALSRRTAGGSDVKTSAACGVRNAECKGKVHAANDLPLTFRVPHSAFRNLLAVALIAAGCGRPAGESVPVTIPPGATLEAAVDSLAARGIVAHAGLFTLYARLHGLRGSLKTGVYLLAPGSPWSAVVDALERGRGVEARFFVPEGLMLAEVAAAAGAQLGVPRDSFLAAARDPELAQGLGLPGDARSVEGYLFPTTYLVPLHIHALDLVRVMTREF